MSNNNLSSINDSENPGDYYTIPKSSRRKTLSPNDTLNFPIPKSSWSLYHRSNSISMPVSNPTSANNSVNVNSLIDDNKPDFWNVPNHSELNHQVIKSDIIEAEQKTNNQRTSSSSSNVNNDSTDSTNEEPPEKLRFGFTKRQLKVFLSLVVLSLNDIMGYSAIAPFFPVVAESKGLSATQYGLIFSSYSICGIFSGLLTGTVLVKVGAKFCVLAGMFWNMGAIFCFGFLDKMAPLPFFILAVISRGLMGFGSNAAFTAMFAIIFQEFSERAITVLSLSEALVGVGGMVAPLIGGGLYDLGGYITPFMVLGSAQVVLLLLCWYMLPFVPIEDTIASRPPLYLITHSSALVSSFIVILIFLVNSFIVSNFGPFLSDQFGIDATVIGVIFLVSSVFYAGMAPIWGYIADKWKNSYLSEVCCLGVACGMALVGPASILRHLFNWSKQHLWLVYVAAACNGMFFGGALMPTFNDMLTAADELNLGDSVLVQYGLVSGLWNTAFSIGDVLGPTLGGVLVQSYSFPDAAAILSIICIAMSLLKLLHRFYRYATRHRRVVTPDEQRPLLGGDPA